SSLEVLLHGLLVRRPGLVRGERSDRRLSSAVVDGARDGSQVQRGLYRPTYAGVVEWFLTGIQVQRRGARGGLVGDGHVRVALQARHAGGRDRQRDLRLARLHLVGARLPLGDEQRLDGAQRRRLTPVVVIALQRDGLASVIVGHLERSGAGALHIGPC